MDIIAFVESEDCGPAVVLDSDLISLMKCDNFYFAASRCVYRGTPITCEVSQEQAEKLISKGVICLDIQTKAK
jgi:hypothetical protein